MASNYSTQLFKEYENVCKKLDVVLTMLEEEKNETKELNVQIKNLNNIIIDLKKEILRLKSKNDKDSSNSSKSSSTNGYKKVITNRREKSNKSKGGQKSHKPHSINNKLNQFINSGNVIEEIIEVNKNELNKNKRYIEKVVIDI